MRNRLPCHRPAIRLNAEEPALSEPRAPQHVLALAEQRRLVEALCRPACYPHAVGEISLIETHISFVILTGHYAYKIKKCLDLGFLDFSTLEKRRFFCGEELRLNRRLAPALYLDVAEIRGTPQRPSLAGAGEAIEYAVKMLQFPQDRLLDAMLARAALQAQHVDALADAIADFHSRAAVDRSDPGYGNPEAVLAPVAQNFMQIRAHLRDGANRAALDAVERRDREEWLRLRSSFAARQGGGFVRECHGDLHLGNIALLDEGLAIFDCIEFNPALRWIDVMSELAFLAMDLQHRGRADYAQRLLNRYLEITGDYGGLDVLPFYMAYRAMVRAKVAAIRAAQEALAPDERERALGLHAEYLAHAAQVHVPHRTGLILTRGVSGSGKTFLAGRLLEHIGAVRLRSDVERKRLQGLPPLARSGSSVGEGLYAAERTQATYARLAQLARSVIEAGFPAIVDATFLKRARRDEFRRLAGTLGVPFVIVNCHAARPVLLARIAQRARSSSDASEATPAVLEHQLQADEPLDADEMRDAVRVDTGIDGAAQAFDDVKSRLRERRAATAAIAP